MVSDIKRIGILTSGGDAPGMNAAVRAVTRMALKHDLEVYGIINGYEGLIKKNVKPLGQRDVSYIINRGGTILYTARCDEFKEDAGVTLAAENCREMGIDAVIAMGGDGTFRGAYDLSKKGIACIGVPCTIDNDIASTDATIGFDTAMNTVVSLIDKIRDTGESHSRCNIIEVMGRHAGDIALQCALATGAVAAIVNEFEFDVEDTILQMKDARQNGKRNFIIIVCEGKGKDYGESLANRVTEETKIEARFSRLGYIQRGGAPSLRDRVLATQMGCAAVDALIDGRNNDVICLKGNNVITSEMSFSIMLDQYSKGRLTEQELKQISVNNRYEIKKLITEKEGYKAYLNDIIGLLSL